MIFLPNKLERYTAALRIAVGKMIEKNGYSAKNYRMLKIIHRTEAMLLSEILPCDIQNLSSSLLWNVYLKKERNFSYSVLVNHNFLINKKLFISLILSLCANSKIIYIGEFKNKILICVKCKKTSEIIPLIKRLEALCFYEIKSGSLNILISAKATEKTDLFKKRDQEIFTGPMSCVNFYIP